MNIILANRHHEESVVTLAKADEVVISNLKPRLLRRFAPRNDNFFITLLLLFLISQAANAAPGISLDLGGGSQGVSSSLQILILLTILSIAPSILLMTTSFIRFVIVFGMLRTALGLGQLPPTQVLIGLSLILTFVVMQPTFTKINDQAIQPFISQQINDKEFFEKLSTPLSEFMLKQTGKKELELALRLSEINKPKNAKEMPFHITIFAFMLSELKKSFQIGFMIFLPFIVIDMVVASALVSVGLMFLPPATLSMPFKIVLFILIDGWNILSEGLILSFQGT